MPDEALRKIVMVSYKTTAVLLTTLLCVASPAHAGKVTRYVHTDHLGSPTAVTDSTGAVIWRQSYAPYGETEQGPNPDGVGYTGHRNDAASGLVYMQARFYDPVIGRFLSTDSVVFSHSNPDHFNRYWYVAGNPYVLVDSAGNEPETAFRAAVRLSMGPQANTALMNSGPPDSEIARGQLVSGTQGALTALSVASGLGALVRGFQALTITNVGRSTLQSISAAAETLMKGSAITGVAAATIDNSQEFLATGKVTFSTSDIALVFGGPLGSLGREGAMLDATLGITGTLLDVAEASTRPPAMVTEISTFQCTVRPVTAADIR